MSDAEKVLYLHIGAEKTGSTSIQSMLFAHSQLLRQSYGIHYPTIERLCVGHAHHALVTALLPNSRIDFLPPQDRLTHDDFGALLRAAAGDGEYLAMILSAEHFSSRLKGEQIADLKRMLVKALPGHLVRILLFVRSQPSLYCSALSTHFRSGGTQWDAPLALLRKNNYYNYLLMIEGWEREFGRQNIRVLNYHQGNAASTLLSALGLPEGALNLSHLANENLSLSYEAIKILDIVGRHLGPADPADWGRYAKRRDLADELLDFLQSLAMQQRPLSTTLRQEDYLHFLAEFGVDNTRLQEVYGLDFNLNDHIHRMMEGVDGSDGVVADPVASAQRLLLLSESRMRRLEARRNHLERLAGRTIDRLEQCMTGQGAVPPEALARFKAELARVDG